MAVPGDGLAQTSGTDPLSLLQQVQRGATSGLGGLGGLTNGVVDTTSNQPQSQTLQPAVGAVPVLPRSRLEQIMSARAGVVLQQYGYAQFGTGRQVTVPETGAVQDDYIMGPGDEVVVSLRGQENSDVRTSVDRNGQVVLPRLPPISAAGRSFGSFRQDVEAAVHRAYVASTASVAIGRVRQISVQVSGEVNVPGVRLLTGLSSVADALLLSGGVRKSGSLRNIHVQRGGHDYIVDLYGLLTPGAHAGMMRLADGDRIVVPPLGRTVAVAGLVRQQGIYELPAHASSISVRSLLALAGGQEVRGRYRLAVQRIEADGRVALVSLSGDTGQIRDSEILRVELGADLASDQATLSGGLGLAGQYPITTGTRLSDVIRAPGALGQSPYTLFGIIVRKDQRTLLRSLIAFTPAAVLGGTEDQVLQTDDIIRPISVNEAHLLDFVLRSYLSKLALDQARIRNPLEAQRADAAAAAQASAAASSSSGNNSNGVATTPPPVATPITPDNPFGLQPGQLDSYSSGQEDFSSVPDNIQRSDIIALLNVAAPGSVDALLRQQAYQQSLLTANGSTANQTPAQAAQAQQAALLSSQTGIPLQAPTAVVGQPYGTTAGAAYGQQSNGMAVNGAAVPGTTSAGISETMSETNGQNNPAGASGQFFAPNYQIQPVTQEGYATNREVHTFGELARQLNVDPLVLVNFLIEHRARLDGAVHGPGPYLVGPNVTLADLVQAAGGTDSWADESGVELLTTVVDSRNGRAASQRQTLPLRQGTLASYIVRPHDQLHFNKVFTDAGIGSVTVQGEIRFAGSYPITRGEHLSDVLMRAGGLTTTAYPQGTVFLRKSAAAVEQDGYNRAADEIQSQLIAGMARIGSDKIPGDAVTAIQGFITQLRTQKPLGRIAMDADPSLLAANPAQDPLLEPGDVVFIPQRPSTVAVLGEVMQPGSYSYRSGMSVQDYIKRAGGYAQFANDDMTFIVMPDGSARRLDTSWLNFDVATLPPGSTIVVPRDLAPLFTRQIILDVTSIMSSFAVTIASLAVLAHNN
ncbi:MAG TPA: SLBB domain-containing protein [Rhizomicrobium sp.]|nr:SLBB domain-containing protein [Rhizomicrobium sp.]